MSKNIDKLKTVFQCFSLSWALLRKDRVIMSLAMLPTTLGLVLYSTAGLALFTKFKEWGKAWLLGKFPSATMGVVAQNLLSVLVVVAIFFIFQWTFVLLVSLLSAPFHQTISTRTESWLRKGTGDPAPKLEGTGQGLWSRTWKTLVNEFKKLMMIIILMIFSLGCGVFAPLAPVAFLFTCLLISVQFLDYNWTRHEWDFKSCLNDLWGNFLAYTLVGCLFLGLLAIPILNLFAMPFMVIYYTCLWSQLHLPPAPDPLKEAAG